MKKEIITIKNIDLSDRIYIFTFEPIISQMVRSVREIGLINPPILEQISDQPIYRIVSGLKRILALKHLKKESTDAYIFTTENKQPNLNLFLMNFYENISIRSLNLIEKSIFLNKLLTKFEVSREKIINDYLKKWISLSDSDYGY
jgi:ParB-like chromosome segregation protein Spo0J